MADTTASTSGSRSWTSALISAGADLMAGILASDSAEDTRQDSKETTLLNLQDNERNRAAMMERLKAETAANLEAAKIQAATQKDVTKKKAIGDLILDQGKDSNSALLEDFKSSANKKERFNDSADNLASLLLARKR